MAKLKLLLYSQDQLWCHLAACWLGAMEIVLYGWYYYSTMSGCDVGMKEAVINSGHARGLQHLPAEE